MVGCKNENLVYRSTLNRLALSRFASVGTSLFFLAIACSDDPDGDPAFHSEGGQSNQDEGMQEGGNAEGEGGSAAGSKESGQDSTPSKSENSDEANVSDEDDSNSEDEDKDESEDSDDGEAIFDVERPDSGVNGEDGRPKVEFSYIWIANTHQGTISKIDTRTMVEKGRYLTRADGQGSPSRTSVNLDGDVAVANRFGGVMKVYADEEDCVDKDGSGTIETSVDDQFLPWGEDECIAWFTPLNYESQRSIQWTRGEFDPKTNRHKNAKVWVSGGGERIPLDVMLLNGDDGTVEAMTTVTKLSANGTGTYGIRSAYGGAVDSKGDFWFTRHGSDVYVGRVKLSDMSSDLFDRHYSGYGITVGPKDRVWSCHTQVSSFDPATDTWAVTPEGLDDDRVTGVTSGGCMIDGENRLWVHALLSAGGDSIVGIDIDTLKVREVHEVPEYVHGISIDFDGNVWGVTSGTNAYRVHPETGMVDTFDGLTGAYTYSDMTGFALFTVTQVD